MQLQARLGLASQVIAGKQRQGTQRAIEGDLVHPVERHIESPRQPAFQGQAAEAPPMRLPTALKRDSEISEP